MCSTDWERYVTGTFDETFLDRVGDTDDDFRPTEIGLLPPAEGGLTRKRDRRVTARVEDPAHNGDVASGPRAPGGSPDCELGGQFVGRANDNDDCTLPELGLDVVHHEGDCRAGQFEFISCRAHQQQRYRYAINRSIRLRLSRRQRGAKVLRLGTPLCPGNAGGEAE